MQAATACVIYSLRAEDVEAVAEEDPSFKIAMELIANAAGGCEREGGGECQDRRQRKRPCIAAQENLEQARAATVFLQQKFAKNLRA